MKMGRKCCKRVYSSNDRSLCSVTIKKQEKSILKNIHHGLDWPKYSYHLPNLALKVGEHFATEYTRQYGLNN